MIRASRDHKGNLAVRVLGGGAAGLVLTHGESSVEAALRAGAGGGDWLPWGRFRHGSPEAARDLSDRGGNDVGADLLWPPDVKQAGGKPSAW
jgi:hypothetical protein